jgi:hypothetical protein
MGTSPIELLPAAGANAYYDIDKIIFESSYGAPWSLGTDILITGPNFISFLSKQILTSGIIEIGTPMVVQSVTIRNSTNLVNNPDSFNVNSIVSNNKFIISGNLADTFGFYQIVEVTNSSTNNGTYSINSATNVGSTTEIIVNESIPSNSVSGDRISVDRYKENLSMVANPRGITGRLSMVTYYGDNPIPNTVVPPWSSNIRLRAKIWYTLVEVTSFPPPPL